MAVEINIDLDSEKAHGKIEALDKHLKTLNDDLNIDFDVDDDLKDKIDKITKDLKEIEVNVDYDDLSKAAALKAMLEGDIDSDLNINTDKALADIEESLDPGGGGGVDHDRQAKKFADQGSDDARFSRFMDRFKRFTQQPRTPEGDFAGKNYRKDFLEQFRPDGSSSSGGTGGRSDRLNLMQRVMDSRRKWGSRNVARANITGTGLGGSGGGGDRTPGFIRKALSSDRGNEKAFSGIKSKLKGMIPSMNTFYSLLAAVIPILAVFITQLLGVATAMGAVAIAGAAMVGLGLVGHGEDMAESFENAKKQLSDLKDDLFDTFQPTMQTFAPIQERFFDMLPGQLNKIATSMEGLTVYSDTLFQAFRGISDFIADGIDGMVKYEGILSQVALRFGAIAGSAVADFFSWLVQEVYESQDMLIRLGGLVKDLISAFYNVSKVITVVVAALRPVTKVLSFIAGLLNSKVIVAIVSFLTTLGLTIWVVSTLTSAVATLIAIWSAGLIATIIASTKRLAGYIFQTLSAAMANNALAASIANVVAFATMGIGALMGMAAAASAVGSIGGVNGGVGGGGGIPTGGGGAGTGSGATQNVVNEGDTYNVEVNGEMSNPDQEGLHDLFSSESGIETAREHPGI